MSNSDIEEIFEIKLKRSPQDKPKASSEDLAETIERVYEITVNIPKKYYDDFEMTDVYKTIWEKIAKEYKSVKYRYVLEYCKTGQLHTHGYLTVNHPANNYYFIDDEIRLKGLWLSIMKLIDKRLFKINNNKYIYKKEYDKCYSPAICINAKNVLSEKWVGYIQKNIL